MATVTAFALFFILWWVMLFVTLPFGHRTQDDDGEVTLGTVSSAPSKPWMLRKIIVNTVVSIIVFGAFWVAVKYFGLSLATFDFLGPQPVG